MTEKTIIRKALKSCNWTQAVLAEKLNYKATACLTSRLSGEKAMRVDTFVKMLSEMGYEVIVRSASPNMNKNQWKVTLEDEADDE